MKTAKDSKRPLALVVAAGVLVALGCPRVSQADHPFVLGLLSSEPITTLDYLDASSKTRLLVEAQIMEGLVGLNLHEDREVEPRLAEYFTRIDRRTYVFRLRNGVYFHPHRHGAEFKADERVTPEDVVFSLLRARNSRSASLFRLDKMETVRAATENLVKIKLAQPDDNLLFQLATAIGHVACKEYYESLGIDDAARKAAFSKAPVGTGPYRLARSLTDGAKIIVLERFERYRDRTWARAQSAVTQVEYRYYDSPTAIRAGLDRREISMVSLLVSALPPTKAPPRTYTEVQLTHPLLSIFAIHLTKPEFSAPLTRKLLNAAVQKDRIAYLCPQGEGELPRGYTYYLEIARRYLREKTSSAVTSLRQHPGSEERLRALRARGPLTILIPVGQDFIRDKIVGAVAADLAAALQVEVTIQATNRLPDDMRAEKPTYDFVYVDWTPNTPSERDGLSLLYAFFYSWSPYNSRYADPSVDQMFEQIADEVEEITTTQLYSRIQTKLLANSPHIWLPNVRGDSILLDKSYKPRFGSSLSVYYSSALKYVEKVRL